MNKTIDDVYADINAADAKVTNGTIARTVVFAVTWLNMLFAFIGAPVLDIDTDALYQIVTVVVTFASSTVGYWKNNSFTFPALVGDLLKNALKNADAQ